MKAGCFLKSEIYIISHKNLKLPHNELYYPLQVGKKFFRYSGYLQDDTGNNIAAKNPHYCELTGQYWAWKNRSADVQGIVHYRRFFANNLGRNQVVVQQPFKFILETSFLQQLLDEHQMILPPKQTFLEPNLWLHYCFQHQAAGMKAVRLVIKNSFPTYLAAFDQVMFHQRSAHMYNMLITRRNLFAAYSSWLFAVLAETEKILDIRSFSAYEQRVFGFLSEFLLNVWVEKNKIDIVEIPLVFTEHRNYFNEAVQFVQRRLHQNKAETNLSIKSSKFY